MNTVLFGLSLDFVSCSILVSAEVVGIILISRLMDETLAESSLYHVPQVTWQFLDPEQVYVRDTHLDAQPCHGIPGMQI